MNRTILPVFAMYVSSTIVGVRNDDNYVKYDNNTLCSGIIKMALLSVYLCAIIPFALSRLYKFALHQVTYANMNRNSTEDSDSLQSEANCRMQANVDLIQNLKWYVYFHLICY